MVAQGLVAVLCGCCASPTTNPDMSTLQDKIDRLEVEIEGYKEEYRNATTPAEKSELRQTITERGRTLNILLATANTAPPAGNYLSSCYWIRGIISRRCSCFLFVVIFTP